MAELSRLPKRNGARYCTCVHDQYKAIKLGMAFKCGDPINSDYHCAIKRCDIIIPNAVGPYYCGKISLVGRKFKKQKEIPKGVR